MATRNGAATQLPGTPSVAEDSLVMFRNHYGLDIRGTLLNLTRDAATFEIYGIDAIVRTSEVLEDFRIFLGETTVYAGRAVVRHCLNAGTVLVCSVLLDEFGFDPILFAVVQEDGQLQTRFRNFVQQWQRVCRVLPEFKVAVADIETFLIDLRRWLEQIELGIRSSPTLGRTELERLVIDRLSPEVIQLIDELFEKFERIATGLTEELYAVHRNYIQRHLHPIVLCAPFAYRSYQKPLGYAGDYETIEMMLRDPREGGSLFAKVFNVWLLHQGSAAAHRNRVQYLKRKIQEESFRLRQQGRKARIYNMACGPAAEVLQFLDEGGDAGQVDFTLLDFNEQTLQFLARALKDCARDKPLARVKLVKKSVHQIIKEANRPTARPPEEQYDYIYCAGLFDYLSDQVCRRLIGVFYDMLAPGGLVVATNVTPLSPNRGSLELILDWHLNYRDARELRSLLPESLPLQDVRLQSDETGVNLFLEARRPHDA